MNLTKFLNQTAVYWATPAPDGFGGHTYAVPVEVKVRWAVKQERFLSGAMGGLGAAIGGGIEEILSTAVILAEQDFEINGRLFLGTFLDLTSDELPESVNALTIKGFNKIPTVKADQFLRKAWLV